MVKMTKSVTGEIRGEGMSESYTDKKGVVSVPYRYMKLEEKDNDTLLRVKIPGDYKVEKGKMVTLQVEFWLEKQPTFKLL